MGAPQGGQAARGITREFLHVEPGGHLQLVSRGPEFTVPHSGSIFTYTLLSLKVGKGKFSFPLLG